MRCGMCTCYGCSGGGVAGREAFRKSMPSGLPLLERSSGPAAAHDRPPTPTALDAHFRRRDYQSRPTDHWGEVRSLGWLPWLGGALASLSAQRSTFKTQGRIRRVMVPDKADSYQTIAPKQLLRLGYMRFLPPKPVPGVARTIKMASMDRQCDTVGGG